MKNIHVIPTPNPSSIWIDNDINKLVYGLFSIDNVHNCKNVNIHITCDEKIKDRDWFIDLESNEIHQSHGKMNGLILIKENSPIGCNPSFCKKIVLTTNQDLIKNGVQAIDDEFLKWFVKNPSCECVDVKEGYFHGSGYYDANQLSEQEKVLYSLMKKYKITIPKEETKEETKQESIEEAAERIFNIPYEKEGDVYFAMNIAHLRKGFKFGTKWQQERSFSEEQVIEILEYVRTNYYDTGKHWHQEPDKDISSKELFEKFKNKC